MKSNCHALLLPLAAAALLLTAGCETTVDLPEPPHTPRLALSYVLTAAPQDSAFRQLYELRQLFISNSQRVFDTQELNGRQDAVVELRDARGAVVERYRPLRRPINGSFQPYVGSYRPVLNFQPQPGQAYTLRATVPGLPPVESTQTLPRPAKVETGTYAPRAANPNGGNNVFRGRLTLTLRDDPAATNYYLAYAQALNERGEAGAWSAVELDYEREEEGLEIGRFKLSTANSGARDLFPFADAGRNGELITLSSDVRFVTQNCFSGTCPTPRFVEVHLSSITPAAYEFYLSRRRYYDSDGGPFAEPAPLASNVQGGYGLFGGATDVTYRIRIQ